MLGAKCAGSLLASYLQGGITMLLKLRGAKVRRKSARTILFVGLALVVLGLSLSVSTLRPPSIPGRPSSGLASLPFSFEPNAGQADASVRFMVHARQST